MHFKTDSNISIVSCRDVSCVLFDYQRAPFCGVATFCTWLTYISKRSYKESIEINPEELFRHVFKGWTPSPCGPIKQIEQIVKYRQNCSRNPKDEFEFQISNCAIRLNGVKGISAANPLLVSETLSKSVKESIPVIVDFPLFLSSLLPMGSPTLKRPNPGEPSLGRHFVLVDGFGCTNENDYPRLAEEFFSFQNCWGSSWGNRGFGRLPLDFINTTPSLRVYYIETEG